MYLFSNEVSVVASFEEVRSKLSSACIKSFVSRTNTSEEGWFGQPKYSTFSKFILCRIGLASSIITQNSLRSCIGPGLITGRSPTDAGAQATDA